MAAFFTYSPEQVKVVIGGFFEVTGLATGSFVKITKDTMPYTLARTADGMVSRKYTNDQTYTIELTLHTGSEFNDILTKMWLYDEATQLGKFPILVKDFSGTDLFWSSTTWIESIPSMEKSDAVEERTWILRSSQGVANIGNNTDAGGLINDLINLATGSVPGAERVF